jgi:hypothetical protein
MQQGGRIDIATLAIASAASAVAAIVTSQFWYRGTPIAAAVTPVIVAFVSEALRHPTERLSRRRGPLTDVLPEAAGADPLPPSEEHAPRPAHDPQIRVYRAGRARVAWRAAILTGLLAFAIAAVFLTVPELIAGGSLGKGDHRSTIFGGKKKSDSGGSDSSQPAPAVTPPPTDTQTTPTETHPDITPQPTPGSEPVTPVPEPEPAPTPEPQPVG